MCNTLNYKALLGSIINMTFRDNIKLIFSSNLNETYTILLQIQEKFNNGKFSKIVNNNDYTSSIKLNKKENMTKLNCNIIQLATIPGISKNISTIILNNYTSINKLIEEYKKNDEYMLFIFCIKTYIKLNNTITIFCIIFCIIFCTIYSSINITINIIIIFFS